MEMRHNEMVGDQNKQMTLHLEVTGVGKDLVFPMGCHERAVTGSPLGPRATWRRKDERNIRWWWCKGLSLQANVPGKVQGKREQEVSWGKAEGRGLTSDSVRRLPAPL